MIRETEITTVTWLMGRGLSIACGLTWDVPPDWNGLPREDKIERIRSALRAEMDAEHINAQPISELLDILARYTRDGWRHEFMTTNWDYLLQREIDRLDLQVQPAWLGESHVYHLNGTVETRPSNNNSSPFLLEEDDVSQRDWTVEANVAYNKMIWCRVFVVIGMSFECATDRFLLAALRRVEDNLPIGEAQWLVLNPDTAILETSRCRIRRALPNSQVEALDATLEAWLGIGMPQLQEVGAIAL